MSDAAAVTPLSSHELPPSPSGLHRYSFDIRLTLDLIVYELNRLVPLGSRVGVVTKFRALFEDLEDRLHGSYTLHPQFGNLTTDKEFEGAELDLQATIYLFSLEEQPLEPHGDTVIVAFRNRRSHKALLYRDYLGISFGRAEMLLSGYTSAQSTGVLGPDAYCLLLVAMLLVKLKRFPAAYFVNDRALQAAYARGYLRYFCPLGVCAGRRGKVR